jgi:hypothetical protein
MMKGLQRVWTVVRASQYNKRRKKKRTFGKRL